MQQEWSWEEMLEAFRGLGGIAENIRLDARAGELFPNSAERPVHLRVPEDLLIPLHALEFTGEGLRLKDADAVSPPVRAFFERYEHAFGPLMYARATTAIAALDSCSEPVKGVLGRNFGMRKSFEGERARRIERRFIEERAIPRGDGRTIAPVLELAGHGARGLPMQHDDKAISMWGPAGGRIDIFHPFLDAVGIFTNYGLAAAQPVAFSLPMRFAAEGIEFAVGRKMHLSDRRGDTNVPRLDVVGSNSLKLSHLMIGHSRFPRLARGIFRTRMCDAGVGNADEQFDRIVQENTARILKLLDVLELEKGATALSLKSAALYQLEAMSWAIGAREI